MRVCHRLVLATLLLPVVAASAVHEVIVSSFEFSPATLVIAPGDTVRWRNTEGSHNVSSTFGLFRNGEPSPQAWTFEFTFNDPGNYPYVCEPHSHLMVGNIVVQEGEAGFVVDAGVAGAWYEPATTGQGFFFDVAPEQGIFAGAWFTWTGVVGEHDWFTFLAAPYQGDTVVADIFRNTGGRFDDGTVVQPPASVVGTLTIQFHDCDSATADYQINETEPPRTGTIDLIRILPASAECLQSNPPGGGAD